MAALQLSDLNSGIDQPELLFGVVAAVGTPWTTVEPSLRGGLTSRGYSVDPVIRVSELLKDFNLKCPYPQAAAKEYDRVTMLMDRGDELRRVSKRPEALALKVAGAIKAKRPLAGNRTLPRRAFIIHQLKHPDEVLWLRHIYGDAFHLLGLYSPRVLTAALFDTESGKDSRASWQTWVEGGGNVRGRG